MCNYKDESFLKREFVDKNRELSDIASDFNVTPQAIHYWVKKYNISRHSKRLEDEEWLRQKYIEEQKSTVEIGEIINENPGTVSYWMKKHGIETRTISESKKGIEFSEEHKSNISDSLKGKFEQEKHPRWEGGYDGYYGSNWDIQKRKTLERDEKCQSCGSYKNLVVHHKIPIRLFKKWDIPEKEDANVLRNLVVLCKDCHTTLHWQKKGEELINFPD